MTASQAREVIAEARRRNLLLTVYHNRRWDSELLTVKRLLAEQAFGDVLRFESRLERWRPQPKGGWRERGEPELAGGLLYDLGTHLIDQALHLFGPVTHVYAELDRRRPGMQVDDDVFLALTHASGVRSHLSATVAQRAAARAHARARFALGICEGARATCRRQRCVRAARPDKPGWGEEPREHWGLLGVGDAAVPVRSEPGAYQQFYAGVVASLRDGAPPPVDPEDAVAGSGDHRGMSYIAAEQRYDNAPFRTVGRSGLKLPPISLGLWHNFGADTPIERQRAILRTAFDLGVTHFDLANNYGTPYGSAESNFGRLFREDFRPYRDELIISTKAGWDMWPGPYGQGGGSRKYVLASLDQSLQRMGLEYVDIFYSHRFDPDTPLEETAGALATAVQQGKALYVGISAYSPEKTVEMATLLRAWNVPLLIHQPKYNLFDTRDRERLVRGGGARRRGHDRVLAAGAGRACRADTSAAFPTDSRAVARHALPAARSTSRRTCCDKVRALNEIARARGQTLAQLAIAWVLRDPRMTSALVGASSVEQLRENVAAVRQLAFSAEELAAIDRIAREQ